MIRTVRIDLPASLSDDAVTLRPLRVDDAPAYVAAFIDDQELGRLLGVEKDPDEQSIHEEISRQNRRSEEGAGARLVIADPATDAFWGEITLHSFEWQHRRCEIGYWLVPAVRGRGLATRAISLAISWALLEFDLLRIEMTTTPDNVAVHAVARRLGFQREGMLRKRNVERGHRVDVVWFGLLREEWTGS